MGGRNRGGQKRGRTQRRHFRDGRQDPWKKPRSEPLDDHPDAQQAPLREAGWDPFVTESPAFEQYYKKQHIVAEQEWDDFLAVLRRPLPAVFRVNSSGQFAMEIRTQIQEEFARALNNEVDGEMEELVKPLPWYPGKLAWHLNFSRMQLRKNQTLARLHEFLKRENEIGNITRQEAVSMLPPLFLDVQPNHQVLDMCAAPGSKTFQLLEMIHGDDKQGSLSNGLVVANDVDVQRCHLLIHQTKRMCSPNVIVTNHEAQHFPGLRKDKDNSCQPGDASENSSAPSADLVCARNTEMNEEKGLVFDRLLCDVPCSGDGTIRKAPDIWKKWNLGIANGLHRLQIQIVMRGVALVRVGGRLVYSTCSLNPVENEAVVGEVLRRSDGCLELLDVSNELPQLKRRPGLRTWKVRDKGVWISTYENVDKHRTGFIVPSMFPTGKGQEDQCGIEEGPSTIGTPQDGAPLENLQVDEDEAGEIAILPLERCLRILPHDQDTGGFFVAVFKKVAALKGEQPMKHPPRKPSARKGELDKDAVCVDTSEVEEIASLGCTGWELCEDVMGRVVPSEIAETDVNECKEEEKADIKSEAKSNQKASDVNECNEEGKPEAKSNRVQRQGNWKGVDPVLFLKDETLISSISSFYGIKETFPLRGHLVTRSDDTSRLKRIYYVSESVANVMRMNFRAGEQIKITSLGLKVFERQGGKEGLSQCAFRIASEGLPLLLPHLTRQLIRASKQNFKLLLSLKTTPFTAFSGSGFITSVQELDPGCCVVILDDGEKNAQNGSSSTAIGCWKGRTNMSLLIPKEEAAQLLKRIFDVDKDTVQSLKDETEAPATEKNVGGEDVNNFMDVKDPLLTSKDGLEQDHADASMFVTVLPVCDDTRIPDDSNR